MLQDLYYGWLDGSTATPERGGGSRLAQADPACRCCSPYLSTQMWPAQISLEAACSSAPHD
jgi:hypothetical protein